MARSDRSRELVVRRGFSRLQGRKRYGARRNDWLVGQQAVDVEFSWNRRGVVGAAGIVSPGADIDLSVGHRGNRKLHCVAPGVVGALGTVPVFGVQSRSIVGMQDGRAAPW